MTDANDDELEVEALPEPRYRLHRVQVMMARGSGLTSEGIFHGVQELMSHLVGSIPMVSRPSSGQRGARNARLWLNLKPLIPLEHEQFVIRKALYRGGSDVDFLLLLRDVDGGNVLDFEVLGACDIFRPITT
ncbi:hypothetical protein [Conyzicola sp.]|uniref:hypothetical protein n=1 Tax=Conyzicola sp. TaxID=1969404 RepID=UPI003989F563